ncbi:hypothetical protein O9992_18720 [Vibrio lentus]|nr:hypothetical protein [Vibrio lentus]
MTYLKNLIHQFEADQQATISWYNAKSSITGQATEIQTPHPIKQTYSVTYRLDDFSKERHAPFNVSGKAVTLTTQLGEKTTISAYLTLPSLTNQVTNKCSPSRTRKQYRFPYMLRHSLKTQRVSNQNLNDGDYVVANGAIRSRRQHFHQSKLKICR